MNLEPTEITQARATLHRTTAAIDSYQESIRKGHRWLAASLRNAEFIQAEAARRIQSYEKSGLLIADAEDGDSTLADEGFSEDELSDYYQSGNWASDLLAPPPAEPAPWEVGLSATGFNYALLLSDYMLLCVGVIPGR